MPGSIPTEIGLMKKIKRLILDNNSLTGTIPSEIGLLTDITRVRIYDNNLVGSIPTEIEILTSMEELFLHDNSIFGTIPSNLLNLTPTPMISVYNTSIAHHSVLRSFYSTVVEPCIICDGKGSYNFVISIEDDVNKWADECSKSISYLNNDEVSFMSTIDECNLLEERCVVCYKDNNKSGKDNSD